MNKIVAAIDFSEPTGRVAEAAAEQAQTHGTALVLLHVVVPEPVLINEVPAPLVNGAARLREARAKLNALRESLMQKHEGLAVSIALLEGSAVDKIRQEAARLQTDLIVMGSHGHGRLHQALLGSTTQGVLRKAGCPVMIVPDPAQSDAWSAAAVATLTSKNEGKSSRVRP